jgi:hypothetical protein
MARRANSSIPTGKLAATAGAVVGLLAIAYAMFGTAQDPFRTTSPFPVKEYLENANSIKGNTYRLEALVDKTLEVTPATGRLFSVEAGGDMLPLLVPSTLNGTNIERGQKLHFRVQVNEKGLLVASEIRKP